MKSHIKEIFIKVPHRISGFFEIIDEINGKKIENPEKIGSRGAGFNLSALGTTRIKYTVSKQLDQPRCNIYINGDLLNEAAETSWSIYEYIRHELPKNSEIEIHHEFELPVGCGYGASGSGALGTIYGLNCIFDFKLSMKEMGRIAHVAEVENRTGLGTVCGQLAGGLCVLKEPGYPCVYQNLSYPNDVVVICGTFGMIHTKSILSDPELNANIKEAGRKALKKLLIKPDLEMFLQVSKEFVDQTKLLDLLNLSKTKQLLDDLNKKKILGASMNQLGRSVFAVCHKNNKKDVLDIFKSFQPEIKIFSLKINDKSIQLE